MRSLLFFFCLASLGPLLACGAPLPVPPIVAKRPPAAITLVHSDARIGTYVSSPWGFSTSSYWIEGPTGLILIDTQFLPSAAEEMVRWAEETTGKKALLAIVLHPNPDKFNGTDVLRKHGIRVVTSDQVRAAIPGVHEKRLRAFYDRYQPDYPREVPLPDGFGASTTPLSAGGITVVAHVLGAGCSEAHVVVEFDKNLFVGDLVANDAHSWLEIGKTDEWLRRIDEMKAMKPAFVHPGRGPSGGAGLLDAESAYLTKVIALVAQEKPRMPVDEAALTRVKRNVEAAYPGLGFSVFLDIGLPAEWERQAKK